MEFALTNEITALRRDDAFMDRAQIEKRLQGAYSKDKDLYNLNEDIEGLNKVAKEFEGIFLNMIFKEMRKTVHDDKGLFPPSPGRKIFQEMLDEEVAKDMSESKSLGIADAVINTYKNNVSRSPVRAKVDFKI